MNISIGIVSTPARTDQGDSLTLYRPYVTVGFRTRPGAMIRLRCLIDSGAPLSVVPFAVWQKRNLAWSSVSKSLSIAGRASALSWQGVPCELGFTEVDLGGTRTLTAKFAMQPTPVAEIILGVSFLVDNDIELILRGTPGAVSGFLSAP